MKYEQIVMIMIVLGRGVLRESNPRIKDNGVYTGKVNALVPVHGWLHPLDLGMF